MARFVTVRATDRAGAGKPPAAVRDSESRWADPSNSAASQALAAADLGEGQRPMALSWRIQRGAFFFALMAA